MAKGKSYIRWAITGDCGLYVGQYLTRRDAIADHVSTRNAALSKFAPLDGDQIAQWKQCMKSGDRAVRVRITVL